MSGEDYEQEFLEEELEQTTYSVNWKQAKFFMGLVIFMLISFYVISQMGLLEAGSLPPPRPNPMDSWWWWLFP
jgi:hypothetical protein